jgi:hypothetical protein
MPKKISDVKPGEWVNVEGYVTGISDGYSLAMAQYGILADETGAIKIVSWKKSNLPRLEARCWYSLQNCPTNNDNGVLNLFLVRTSIINKIPAKHFEIPGMIPVCDINYGVVSIRAIVLSNDTYHRGDVIQKGWLGDESGFRVPYTIKKEISHEPLIEGQIYRFLYCLVERYQNHQDLTLDHSIILENDDDEVTLDPCLTDYIWIQTIPQNPLSKHPCEVIMSFLEANFDSWGQTRSEKISTLLPAAEILTTLYSAHQHKAINYQDTATQAAYMLRYFPYYIETSYNILKAIDTATINPVFIDDMSICLYGCGPAPELLGILKYIQNCQPNVRTVNINFFDKHEWSPWRDVCTRMISREYWSGKIDKVNQSPWNYLTDNISEDPTVLQMIRGAGLHSIQNCFSDLIYSDVANSTIINTFTNLFEMTSSDCIFILSDQNIATVKTIFNQISDQIEQKQLGEVIKKPTSYESHPPDCSIPPDLMYLMSQRKMINYYPLILKRT